MFLVLLAKMQDIAIVEIVFKVSGHLVFNCLTLWCSELYIMLFVETQ